MQQPNLNQYDLNHKNNSQSAHRDMLIHVLLLIFTCGIYQLYWIYKTTQYLNDIDDYHPTQNPLAQLLLCMFVPFYQVYWVYINAKRIDYVANGRGIESDITLISFVLAFFVMIGSSILMQDMLNQIESQGNLSYEFGVETEEFYTPKTNKKTTKLGVADEILKYKKLMDDGIISKEEFDQKKKELLGL